MSEHTDNILYELNQDLEKSGFSYDPDQDIFYSNIDCWQREFGYCRIYDESAPALGMIFDCEPICFQYDGKEWLIELWKGQYGIATGGEVGVYSSKAPQIIDSVFLENRFYQSVPEEDFPEISFVLERDGSPLFSRQGLHWWLTGFKPGQFSQPEQLAMRISLTLKDAEMCDAFAAAMIKAGYPADELTRSEKNVSFLFSEPRTPQPCSGNALSKFLVQKANRGWCYFYHRSTCNCNAALDGLYHLYKRRPRLYKKMLRLGKPPQLYQIKGKAGISHVR